MNNENESRSGYLPTDAEAAIQDRALRFASTFTFVNPKIVGSAAARDEDVAKYGTPGSSVYGEVRIHMDWGPGKREVIGSTKLEQRADVERFLESGVELLVVCTPTDVIRYEFVQFDFD